MTMDINKTVVDWFAVDLERFEAIYADCLSFHEQWSSACAEFDACYEFRCEHTERRRRKDGLPDKRYTCPVGDKIHYWILDNQYDQRLELIEFFKEVGLVNERKTA